MDEAKPDHRQNLKSLFKLMQVLECFSAREPELTVVQIARKTGLPRTTVHRLADSLRAVGLLEQEASRERYRLGLKLFELGSSAITTLPLHREAGPFVETLARLSGETVHLCLFDGTQMVFVERVNDRARSLNTVTLLEATPCHCTGVGKAALAFQPEAVIERVIALGLPGFTARTIVDPPTLRAELALIRERGFAIDDGEHEPNVRCVAAPIRNTAGRVFAAISASGTMRRVPRERVPEFAELVVAHARQISARLGCRDDEAILAKRQSERFKVVAALDLLQQAMKG
ncbi:MAG: IclR family transcriptional regulator [Enhydrobacter sp.]|nr:MAG: IclR family transcriptional regulator [Enhydrobacter sp.]